MAEEKREFALLSEAGITFGKSWRLVTLSFGVSLMYALYLSFEDLFLLFRKSSVFPSYRRLKTYLFQWELQYNFHPCLSDLSTNFPASCTASKRINNSVGCCICFVLVRADFHFIFTFLFIFLEFNLQVCACLAMDAWDGREEFLFR